MRHRWWYHGPRDRFYAVSVDDAGAIRSAWMQVDAHEWVALADFEPLRLADERGEIHRNDADGGWTAELCPSLGPVQ